MLGSSSVAAVEEVAGGVVFRYYWIACLRLHAYGCVLLRVGAADGMECVAGGTQKPEKVCGKGCS